LKSTCINCFKLSEVKYLHKLGVKNWELLSCFIPQNLSNHYHHYQRKDLEYSCTQSIKILKNKNKIHNLTPSKWKPPFIFFSKKKNKILNTPNWLSKSLDNQGIILKPNSLNAGKNILKIHRKDSELIFVEIFSSKYKKYKKNVTNPVTTKDLINIWENHYGIKSDLLIMPYLNNNKIFPKSYSTAILRVITTFGDLKKFNIDNVWWEIPLNHRNIAIADINSNFMPLIKELSEEETKIIENWSKFLKKDTKKRFISEALNASIKMHKKLPLIDTVAWDWIIGNKLTLLEGNSSYGLLIPQSIKFKNNQK